MDNELNGDSLETTNQTVGIKGTYGTMSYGLGWEADGDLGFSIGTSLGGVGLTISELTSSTYSMGLGANVDLGGGMKLSATNAQNSDGLTDVKFNNAALSLECWWNCICIAPKPQQVWVTHYSLHPFTRA